MRAASRFGAVAVLGGICAVELLLADRKFGLFSGGFGMSRAVDTPGELAAFALGYAAAQSFVALAVWSLIARIGSGRSVWPALFHFAFGFGGLFVLALASTYQLHSYFSDAMSFALMKQLGGGSLGDALLFSMNEIAIGLGALALAGLAYWLAWRWFRRRAAGWPGPPARPHHRLAMLTGAATVAAMAMVPPWGGDAAFGLGRTLVWSLLDDALAVATDFDGDGYGLFGIARDSHPFDAARHPLALDIPGNGVDEDGFAGDLRLVPVPRAPAPTLLGRNAPNLIVVVMESTRADVIGKRVDGKVVAPHLEALVREGGATVPSFSHVAFTTASLKSLFAGALQPQPGDPSLFTDLKASGYRIGVFSGQPEDFGDISATVRMRESADDFVDAESLKDKRAFGFAAQGSLLVDERYLLEAFDAHYGKAEDWDRPVFAYFNFQSPHFPYHHDGIVSRITDKPIPRSEIAAARRAWLERTYWNAVASSDHWLGELVSRLKKLGVWQNTILVVTGDHGEDLFEDGFLGHGHIINARQYATFFAVNRPGIAPEGPIGLSDYRGLLLAAMAGRPSAPPEEPPFLHIGPLESPTAIGLAEAGGALTTLRLDTREACFGERRRCRSYDALDAAERPRVDRLVARWGSERWAARQAAAK